MDSAYGSFLIKNGRLICEWILVLEKIPAASILGFRKLFDRDDLNFKYVYLNSKNYKIMGRGMESDISCGLHLRARIEGIHDLVVEIATELIKVDPKFSLR